MSNYVLALRRDTEANFTTDNIVLAAGEPAYSTDVNKLKIGDGTTDWVTLPYLVTTAVVSDGDKGDITVSAGGGTWTIDNGVVTYAKMQDVSASDKILGRSSAGAGDVEEIDCTAAGRALLDDANAAAQRTTLGLGTLATQSGTFSGTHSGSSSGTNTGDQNTFSKITIAGQSDVDADAPNDTLTLIAGSNITLTTNASADEITISASGGGGGGGGTVTSITAGTGLSGGTITSSGTISVNFGSTSTTACVGDDARLSDARTPTAHTHPISDVTNLQTSLDAKVDDSQVSAFGLTLIDDADAATARTTLGLGSIATQDANNIAVTGGSLQGVTVTTGTYSSPVNQGLLITVRKSTSGTITKGRPVYIVGSTGSHLTVELAQADTEATSAYTIGVAATDITNTADGFVMLKGRLTGLNNLPTSTFADGDTLYLDETTAGGLRKTLPTAPNHGVFIGFVVKANNGSAGEMDVHIQNYQELEELSDVYIASVAADHFLKRNATNTRWENVSPANARTGLGLGTLATQSGTFSGTSSGTNTGDQNVFTTIAVAGQSNVVADSTTDTLTLIAGTNITITTNATNDEVTINSTGGGGGVDEDFVIAMALALG